MGKNVPELETRTWLKTSIVTADGRRTVLANVDEVLECLDEDCATDLFQTYVEPLGIARSSDITAIAFRNGRGVHAIVYRVRSGDMICLAVHRADLSDDDIRTACFAEE